MPTKPDRDCGRTSEMRKRAEFQRKVEEIMAECIQHGMDLDRSAVEELLAVKVKDMAAVLRVREDTIVRSYLTSIDPAGIAASLKAALDHGARELADTTPTILDLASTGRLVASLGQAVRCVSLNHAVIIDGDKAKWTAIGVLDNASNSLTLIGAALENADITDGAASILLNDETVVLARSTLSLTVDNLKSETWTYGNGPELDQDVAERMAADLALLPPASA